MVFTRKQDQSPRMTVDLSPLNKYCKKETCTLETLFKFACRFPKGVFNTVTDAWNGYHGVPLHKHDKHPTTFIITFGKFRYARAPSIADYNFCFAAIKTNFKTRERCVNDTFWLRDRVPLEANDRISEKSWQRRFHF